MHSAPFGLGQGALPLCTPCPRRREARGQDVAALCLPLAGRLAAPVASRPSRYAVATRALTRLPQLMKPTIRHDSGYPIDGVADNRRWLIGVVCGRGRNPTLRLWPTIFSGKIDVFPGDRRSRLISSMTSVAPA